MTSWTKSLAHTDDRSFLMLMLAQWRLLSKFQVLLYKKMAPSPGALASKTEMKKMNDFDIKDNKIIYPPGAIDEQTP